MWVTAAQKKSGDPHRLVLPGGRRVRIRPIRPDDADELQEAFAVLSDAARYQRFLTGTSSLNDRVARYLVDIDHTNHEALVAMAPGSPDIVGVARFIRSGTTPAEAELAITVADQWQRAGLGTALLDLLSDRARAEGIRWFTMEMLSDNAGIRALVQAAGGEIDTSDREVLSGRIDLVPGSRKRAAPARGARAAPRADRLGVSVRD
jgi:GNAT superfamily N-acetyltransferase